VYFFLKEEVIPWLFVLGVGKLTLLDWNLRPYYCSNRVSQVSNWGIGLGIIRKFSGLGGKGRRTGLIKGGWAYWYTLVIPKKLGVSVGVGWGWALKVGFGRWQLGVELKSGWKLKLVWW